MEMEMPWAKKMKKEEGGGGYIKIE